MSVEIGQKDNLLDSESLRAYYANDRLLWRNVAVLAVANLSWGIAVTITLPLAVFRLIQFGITEGWQGTVGSINAFLLSFIVMYFSWRSDHTSTRFGRRKPYIFLAAGPIILSIALFPYCSTVMPLVGLWLLGALFTDIKASTYPLLSIDCVRRDVLARANAVLSIVNGVFTFFMMRLTPYLDRLDPHLPFLVGAGAIALATAALVFVKEPDIHHPATEAFKPWSALKVGLRDRRIVWLMLGVSMVASFQFMLTVWTWLWAKTSLGLDKKEIFDAISWIYLVPIVMAYPTGWFIDKLGGFRAVLVYHSAAVVSLILLFFVHDKFTLTLLAVAMTVIAPLYSGADMMVYKTAEPKDVGSFTSSNAFIRNLYNGMLYLFSGWWIQFSHRDYHAIFVAGGVMSTVGVFMFFVYRAKMNGPGPSAPPSPEMISNLEGERATAPSGVAI